MATPVSRRTEAVIDSAIVLFQRGVVMPERLIETVSAYLWPSGGAVRHW